MADHLVRERRKNCEGLWNVQDVMQPVKRQRQSDEDDETRAAAMARQRRRERDREQDRARERIKREREAFGGCYAPVLEAMLQPLPKQVRPCRPGFTLPVHDAVQACLAMDYHSGTACCRWLCLGPGS